LECHPIADICIIGPLNNNEYFVATSSPKEKFIKIWNLPTENKNAGLVKTLEGHNKSTFKLFFCSERKSLLSAGHK
jgi:WD40 repeat protein